MKNLRNYLRLIFVLMMVACDYGRYPENIGSGYRVDFTTSHGGDKTILDSVNSVIVLGPVLDYKFDSRFIIAVERPYDSVTECVGGNYADCRDAFKKSTFRQYWIIDKEKAHEFDERTKRYSNAYGPFNEEEYQAKRKELSIPDGLELDAKP
jgi:hypothetical protein